jgi:RNA polymerase sigma-70 factor (ECF subfamily)
MPVARPLSEEERSVLDAQVRTMAGRLAAYAQRMGVGRQDAEDLVAEVFARAADDVRRLYRAPQPEFYLLRIARNLCRDRLRRRFPATRPTEWLDSGATSSEPGAVESCEAVRTAVRELPEAQREVIVLRYSVGLKFAEIAALLEIPLGTALSRANAAMQTLRDALGESCGTARR